jgi:CHASE3 domain sensor protein
MNQSAPSSPPRHGLHQWWLDRSIRVKGTIVVTLPLLALILIVLASVVLRNNERQERKVGQAASALSSSANQVRTDALNAETAVRGYVATGDPVFLNPYNTTLSRISADIRTPQSAAAAEGDRAAERAAETSTARAMAQFAHMRAAVSAGASASTLRRELLTGKKTLDAASVRSRSAHAARNPAWPSSPTSSGFARSWSTWSPTRSSTTGAAGPSRSPARRREAGR